MALYLVVLVGSTTFTGLALAQKVDTANPTTSSAENPSAPLADDNSEANKARARVHFQRGVELFNQGDNEGALSEFRTANELVYHPKVWFNIGMVLAELNQPVEAVDAFDRALANSSALEPELTAIAKKRRDALWDTIGTLEIRSTTADATVRIDGVEFGTTPLSRAIPLARGRHVVELLKPDYKLLRREPVVTGRGHFVLEVVMDPHVAAQPTAPLPIQHTPAPSARSFDARLHGARTPSASWHYPAAYTSFAIGGASLLLAGISVGVGRSLCPTDGCPPSRNADNAGSYDTWRTTAIVTTLGGVLFAGAGLVLLLLAPDETSTVALTATPDMVHARLRF